MTDNYSELKASPKLCVSCKQTVGRIVPIFDYERNGRWVWLHQWSSDCAATKYGLSLT